MTDNINKISKNLDHVSQQTTASLAHLTDDDVVKIWDSVSAHIESFLKQSKGIIIHGFGTFSFIQKRIDVGNNKHLLIQRPVFILSEKVIQTHGLKSSHYPVNGSIPIHPLNYFHIQTQSAYTRDQIEQCVKHVLQVFNRSIAAQRNVEFTFVGIGKLQIRDHKVKMRFFKDFVQSVDENGGTHTIETMCNRPQTCDSVMSEREATRPATSSNVVLPRLNSRIGNHSMQAIQEENTAEVDQADQREEIKKNFSTDTETISSKDESNRSISRIDELKLPPLLETAEEATPHLVKTSGPSSENVIPIASIFSTADLIQTATTPVKKPTAVEPSIRRSMSVQSYEQPNINSSGNKSTLGFTRPLGDRMNTRDHLSSSLNLYSQKSAQTVEKPQTSCGHYGPGQDLCHLCAQRAKRNIPIFLHEEKQIRDAAEEKLLEEYRHNREVEEQKQRELKIKAAREEKQKLAAFNWGIAEAKRAQKVQRPTTSDVPRSIIFRKRVRTPPSFIRQQDFAKQLEAQIKSKKDEQRTEHEDRNFLERVEQIQLAESLVQERENYFRNKRLHQDELKNALDEQIRNKPAPLPPVETETAYFGLKDTTKEQLQQRRLQAMELFRQQKDIVEQRQRQLLLRQMRDQEYETDTLKSINDDLLTDRRQCYRRNIEMRKDLEVNWTQAAQEKKQRDQDERQHLYGSQGLLVHEQCDQYKRCAQCQRHLDNRGQSKFWKDTRFVPGTHIIV